MYYKRKNILLLLFLFSLSALPLSIQGNRDGQGKPPEQSLPEKPIKEQSNSQELIPMLVKGVAGFALGTTTACVVVYGLAFNKKTDIRSNLIVTLTALGVGGLTNALVHHFPKATAKGIAAITGSLIAISSLGYYLMDKQR